MTRAILLCLALAACAEPRIVTRTETALPAPPSADLLVAPAPPVTAGSKDMGEVVGRLAAGIVERDRLLDGWRRWWADAQQSR